MAEQTLDEKTRFETRKETGMNLRPLHDNVVVKRKNAEEISRGGIIIPGSAQKREAEGSVVAVGPGLKDSEMQVKVGDRIIFSAYAGSDVEVQDEPFVVVKETEILAVIDGNKNELTLSKASSKNSIRVPVKSTK